MNDSVAWTNDFAPVYSKERSVRAIRDLKRLAIHHAVIDEPDILRFGWLRLLLVDQAYVEFRQLPEPLFLQWVFFSICRTAAAR